MKLLHFLFIFLVTTPAITFSQSADIPVSTEQQKAADLTYLLPDSDFEEVQAGELSLPVVVSTSNVPISKGAAILVTDVGQTQFSSPIIGPLMRNLNNHGWNTLSIFSPSIGLSYGISSDNQSEQLGSERVLKPITAVSPFSSENFEQQEQQLLLFMNGVMQRAGQYPGFAIVIAEGTSAAWLTKLYAERKLRVPDSLVIVNPYWPDVQMNQTLPSLLTQAPLPILDIFNRSDNIWTSATTKARLKAAVVGLKPQYRQRELVGLDYGEAQSDYLANEIIGWTRFLGW